jgi:hypothetical protein
MMIVFFFAIIGGLIGLFFGPFGAAVGIAFGSYWGKQYREWLMKDPEHESAPQSQIHIPSSVKNAFWLGVRHCHTHDGKLLIRGIP